MIDCVYDEVSVFQKGIARIKNQNGISIINRENKFIVPFIYDDIDFPFYNDATAVFKNGRIGLIDIWGNEILSPKEYDYIWWIPTDELVRVENNNKEGFLDWKKGKEIVKCIYDAVSPFYEGLAKVKLNSKWGFIDNKGEIIIPIEYESAGTFSNGLASVRKSNKEGFIDKLGSEVIKAIYNETFSFCNGYALIRENENYNFSIKMVR